MTTVERDLTLPSDLTTGHSLTPLFTPRGVIVVGASSDPTKLGGTMAASLARRDGYLGLVNARGGTGMHTSIADAVAAATEPVDLAVLCVPAAACADAVTACGEAGIRAALVCAGGFAETGGEGVRHEQDLVRAARRKNVRLLGPNTSGFFVPGSGLLASFVPGVASLQEGPVGLVAASGGLNHALAFALQREDAGLSLGVGIGAGLDVSAPEVLDYLAHDPATTAVALHLETVADGDALLAAIRQVSQVKPVVAMIVGQHDIGDFARSHTGALATSWRTTRSLVRQAGAILADDVDELVVAVSVLARARARANADPGAALVTGQAGPGLIVADALHEGGVTMPTLGDDTVGTLSGLLPPMTYQLNPVDTGRPGPRHDEVIRVVASDPSIDVVGVYSLTEPVVDLVTAVEPARQEGVPVVIGIDGPADDVDVARHRATQAGTALVVGPRALAIGMRALVEDARIRARRSKGANPEPLDESVGPVTDDLTESVAKDLLDRLGIVTPSRRTCDTTDEAEAAINSIGAPVVMKVSDATILHKSDVGGVRLGVGTGHEARAAFADLAAIGSGQVLVESMAPPGVDLLVSARRDPVFGPVVVVGVGGTATEIYADVAIASVPATTDWLAQLPDELQARKLLDGHRGGPVVDRAVLGGVLARLGDLLLERPEITEIEINPLRATHGGLVALDAVVLVERDGTNPESTSPESTDPDLRSTEA